MSTLTALAILLGCAAVFDDVRRRAVSNWITLGACGAGLLQQTLSHGIPGLAAAAGGGLAGLLVFFPFYWMGGMGAGDIKLMAAFGTLLGPSGILLGAFLAAPAGALLLLPSLAWRRGCRAVPYAPAIAIGCWLALIGQG